MAKLQPAILFSQYSQYSLLFPLISCGNNPFIRCTVTIMLFSSVSIFSWLLGCLWPCHHPACHPSRSSTYLISLFFFTGLDFDWIYLLFALVYLIIWTNVQSKETGIVSKFGKLDFSFFFFSYPVFSPLKLKFICCFHTIGRHIFWLQENHTKHFFIIIWHFKKEIYESINLTERKWLED